MNVLIRYAGAAKLADRAFEHRRRSREIGIAPDVGFQWICSRGTPCQGFVNFGSGISRLFAPLSISQHGADVAARPIPGSTYKILTAPSFRLYWNYG